MANALLIGVSGMTAHQRMIEVVGHNLANMNTTGYKASRVGFADLFYDTVRSDLFFDTQGETGDNDAVGGANPAQIGNGSKVSVVGVNFSQGGFDPTNNQFDFAISGDGFFVVNSEVGEEYTRAGSFSIDQNGFLVDAASGKLVQRFGSLGETTDFGPALQSIENNNIQLPVGANIPGKETTSVSIRGNLNSTNEPDSHQILTSLSGYETGGAAADLTTLLNDLDTINVPYQPGDAIRIDGTDHDGNAVDFSVAVDNTTTLGDLIDGINATLPGATASLTAAGEIQIESDTAGPSDLLLTVTNEVGNIGELDLSANPILQSQAGTEGNIVSGGFEVFDELGGVHSVGIEITKEEDGTWTLEANIDDGTGTMVDAVVEDIHFDTSGAFVSAGGAGTGDTSLVFDFGGVNGPQTVSIDFGDPGTLTALTSYATSSSFLSDQDGFSTGTLIDVHVDDTGIIEGVGSNGRRFPLAQMAIATFANNNGLEKVGDNFYQASSISGDAQVGAAATSGRGSILSGHLEQSNVEIAVEFTRLILAQRGFSANSRTITVTNEILEELTNLIR